MNARKLSRELRKGDDDFLRHRRVSSALALVSMASLGVVALYQMGVIRSLPEPRLANLNAEKVHGSPEAYQLLGTPDAVLGLGSYAATLGLTAMGRADRAATQPWIPLALAGKAFADAAQAAMLTRKSWVKSRAFSLYSLITAAATFATLFFVLPEAMSAGRRVVGGE